MPGFHSTLFASDADGTAVTATSEASLLPANWRQMIAAGYLQQIRAKQLRIRASGRISNIVTTPGTLTLKVKLGPTANIAALTSRAFSLNTTARTNVQWALVFDFTVRAIGTGTGAALFPGCCNFTTESLLSSPANGANDGTWMDTPANGTGFDSGIANQFDLTAQFSVSGNSMTCHTFGLDDLMTVL